MLVFLLPGLGGSVLQILRADGSREQIATAPWNAPLLHLGPDGHSPGSMAGGVQLVADHLNVDYYTPLHDRLATVHRVVDLPYDWRLGIPRNAELLAPIIAEEAGGGPYAMVGHSMGGMLARLLYTPACTRIITLGTPHWGSYSAPLAFTRQGDIYEEAAWYMGLFALVSTFGEHPRPSASGAKFVERLYYGYNLQLDTILGSWPSVYDLFPSLQESHPDDPQRFRLFEPSTWPTTGGMNERDRFPHVDTAYLAFVRDTVHPAIAAAVPPPSVLLSIIGQISTVNTPDTLLDYQQIRYRDSFGSSAGDIRVTVHSASYPTVGPRIWALHAELSRTSPVLDNILDWLTATLPVPQPAVDQDGRVPPVGPGITIDMLSHLPQPGEPLPPGMSPATARMLARLRGRDC